MPCRFGSVRIMRACAALRPGRHPPTHPPTLGVQDGQRRRWRTAMLCAGTPAPSLSLTPDHLATTAVRKGGGLSGGQQGVGGWGGWLLAGPVVGWVGVTCVGVTAKEGEEGGDEISEKGKHRLRQLRHVIGGVAQHEFRIPCATTATYAALHQDRQDRHVSQSFTPWCALARKIPVMSAYLV